MSKAVSEDSPVIYGDGKQYRDFVFVNDVVSANLLAASVDEANGKIINIGIGKYVAIDSLWEMACHLCSLNIEPEYKPPRDGDIVESVANIDHAEKVLGFKPEYSFEKGLEITLNWYKDKSNRLSDLK